MQLGVAQEPVDKAAKSNAGLIQDFLKGTIFNKEKISTSDIFALRTLSYVY